MSRSEDFILDVLNIKVFSSLVMANDENLGTILHVLKLGNHSACIKDEVLAAVPMSSHNSKLTQMVPLFLILNIPVILKRHNSQSA